MTTYKNLLTQREVLNGQIEEAKKAETTAAIAKARELVAQYEMKVEDVFSKTASKKGKKIGSVAPKYRDLRQVRLGLVVVSHHYELLGRIGVNLLSDGVTRIF